MKKKFISAAFMLLGISLVGCDSKDEPAYEIFGDSVATLVVPSDASKATSAQNVQYTFEYTYGDKAMDFAIKGLKYDGVDYAFQAEGIQANNTDYFNGKIQSFNTSMMSNNAGGTPASNVSAKILTMLNFRPADVAPWIAVKRQYDIKYNVGDLFTARTFDSNAYYFGTTATTYIYNNEHKEFTSEKPVYNVVLDVDNGTATVAIYNPVFAAEMPPSMASTVMQLEGLTIEYLRDSYRVSGENIIPKIQEGAFMVPYPAFTFDNFVLTARPDDLRAASLSFKVAGKYDGAATITCALDRNA